VANKTCNNPACANTLTGRQTKFCSQACQRAMMVPPGRKRGHNTTIDISVRRQYGEGVIVGSPVYAQGVRGALLACSCGPDTIYWSSAANLAAGRVVSCGHLRGRGDHELGQARDAARKAAETALERFPGYEVVKVLVKRKK
jgi:hypothetical protein